MHLAYLIQKTILLKMYVQNRIFLNVTSWGEVQNLQRHCFDSRCADVVGDVRACVFSEIFRSRHVYYRLLFTIIYQKL